MDTNEQDWIRIQCTPLSPYEQALKLTNGLEVMMRKLLKTADIAKIMSAKRKDWFRLNQELESHVTVTCCFLWSLMAYSYVDDNAVLLLILTLILMFS